MGQTFKLVKTLDITGPVTRKPRKLCYREDDRAMRPTYGCPENFRDMTTSTATIPNIFMDFCSGRPYECSYKI